MNTKPGYKTTEFWLAAAAKLLGLLYASGVVADGSIAARIAGLATMVLASAGYSVSRGMAKSNGGGTPIAGQVLETIGEAPKSSQAGFANAALMIAIAGVLWSVVLVAAACGPKTTATIHDTATCAESGAKKDLEPVVVTILTSGVNNWQAQLEALATAFGGDLLDCVVAAVKSDLLAKTGAAAGSADAIKRADAWLNRGKSAALEGGGGLSAGAGNASNSLIMSTSNVHARGGDAQRCESASAMPLVNCGDGVMSYDGCRWACSEPIGFITIAPAVGVRMNPSPSSGL